MHKLAMKSVDGTEKNIEKMAELFPNVITETRDENGKVKRVVDFDLLKQELSDILVEGDKERYQLTWPGKKEAIIKANTPIDKTLRPIKDDSEDWDNTENLYIEGDNLEVLKLLQESYLNKVKCIYIDPPYNTGQDFIYSDNFSESHDKYIEESGQVDEEGNRLYQNTESNGRFHSDWLTMMYSRLKISRNLLSEDGLIFISIDDHEYKNLKYLLDIIFGKNNSLIPFIWELPRGINAGNIAKSHEYILVYAKNKNYLSDFKRLEGDTLSVERCNKKIDARHPASKIHFPAGFKYEGPNQTLTGNIAGSEEVIIHGELNFKDGKLIKDVALTAGWTMKRMILDYINGKDVYDSKGQKIEEFVFRENGKLYSKKRINTQSVKSVLKKLPDTQRGRIEMKELLGSEDIFPYPKPTGLIYTFLKLCTNSSDIVLDFFSGSATTAHAVMQLNAEDGGNRKYIMVQLPEETDEKSEAYNAGYSNISEIGKERIRRAAKKIKDETKADIDYGFRVFRLDSSNMKDVYYTPDKLGQSELDDLISNIKDDRTGEDLLAQVMLECGLELSLPMESKQLEGRTIHYVAGNSLIACFDEDVPESVIEEMAKEQPLRVVFRDSSFADDSARINVEERFKMLSPNTEIQVL